MPNLPQHPFDSVADELARWINDEAKWYAQALIAGYRSPFSASVSETDKLAYYRRQMFMTNEDGSVDYDRPNNEGRNALYKRLGVQQYAEVAKAVAPGRGTEYIEKLSLEIPEGEDDGGSIQYG